jgi:hypothetical protein
MVQNSDLCDCGYQVHFIISVCAGIIKDIVRGPYLLPERLAAQQYRDFKETVLLALPLAVRQRLQFQRSTENMSGSG